MGGGREMSHGIVGVAFLATSPMGLQLSFSSCLHVVWQPLL